MVVVSGGLISAPAVKAQSATNEAGLALFCFGLLNFGGSELSSCGVKSRAWEKQ